MKWNWAARLPLSQNAWSHKAVFQIQLKIDSNCFGLFFNSKNQFSSCFSFCFKTKTWFRFVFHFGIQRIISWFFYQFENGETCLWATFQLQKISNTCFLGFGYWKVVWELLSIFQTIKNTFLSCYSQEKWKTNQNHIFNFSKWR